MDVTRDRRGLSETRKAIVNAAQKLFAREGIERVTTRALAADAGVNIAAISYHFGGKEALTLLVLREVARRAAARRIRSLVDIEARRTAPSIREIVDAFVDAYINDDDPDGGRLLARFVLKHRVEPTAGTSAIVAQELDAMALRYVAALARAAPWLTGSEVHLRYRLMVGAILTTLSDDTADARMARLSGGTCRTTDRTVLRAGMVDFLVASFGPEPGERPGGGPPAAPASEGGTG